MDFVSIDLPPGNEIEDYTPIASFGKRKEASVYAHSLAHRRQISVQWQQCNDGNYAVYVEARKVNPLPARLPAGGVVIPTPIASPGVSTPGDILGDVFFLPEGLFPPEGGTQNT